MKSKNDSTTSQSGSESSPKLLCYEDGIYQGYFHNNYRSGLGIFIWHTGEFYFGEWKDDRISGEGLVFFSDGSYAHSFFSNSKADGTGFLRVNSQDVFMGYWKNGSLDGQCYLFNINENVWFLCEYHDGILSSCIERGVGLPLSFPSSKKSQKPLSDLNVLCDRFYKEKEQGDFKLSCFSFSDGAIYLGSVLKSVPHGLGLFRFNDGKVHLGFYEKGVLSGFCNAHFQNGDFFAGQVKNGRYEGEGLLWNAQTGEWIHGKFVEGQLIGHKTSSSQADFKLIESINRNYLKELSRKTMRSKIECEFFSMPERKSRKELENMYELRTLLHLKNPMEAPSGSKDSSKLKKSVSPKRKPESLEESDRKNNILLGSLRKSTPIKGSAEEKNTSKSPASKIPNSLRKTSPIKILTNEKLTTRSPAQNKIVKSPQNKPYLTSARKLELSPKSKLLSSDIKTKHPFASPLKSPSAKGGSSLLSSSAKLPSKVKTSSVFDLAASTTLSSSVKAKYIRTEENERDQGLSNPESIIEKLTLAIDELKTNEEEYLKYVARLKERNLDKVLKVTLMKKKNKILGNIEGLKQALSKFSSKNNSELKRSVVEETQTFIQRLRSEGSDLKHAEKQEVKRSVTPKNNRSQAFEISKANQKLARITGKSKTTSKTTQSSIEIRKTRNKGSASSLNSAEKNQVTKNLGYIYNSIISNGTKSKKKASKSQLRVEGLGSPSLLGRARINSEPDALEASNREEMSKERYTPGSTMENESKLSSLDLQVPVERQMVGSPIIYEENQAEARSGGNSFRDNLSPEQERKQAPKLDEKSFEDIKQQIKQLSENIQNNIKDIVKILPNKNPEENSTEKIVDVTPAFKSQSLIEPQSFQHYLTSSPSGSRIVPVINSSTYFNPFFSVTPLSTHPTITQFSQPYTIDHPKILIPQRPAPLITTTVPAFISEIRVPHIIERSSPLKREGISLVKDISSEFSSNPFKNQLFQQKDDESKLFSSKKESNSPPRSSRIKTPEDKRKSESPVYRSIIDTRGVPLKETYLKKSQVKDINRQESEKSIKPEHGNNNSDFQSDCEECAKKAMENCPVCKMNKRNLSPNRVILPSVIREPSPIRIVRYNEKNEPYITYLSKPGFQNTASTSSLIADSKIVDNLILRTPPRVSNNNIYLSNIYPAQDPANNHSKADSNQSGIIRNESVKVFPPGNILSSPTSIIKLDQKPSLFSTPLVDSSHLKESKIIFPTPYIMGSYPIRVSQSPTQSYNNMSPGSRIIRQNSQEALPFKFSNIPPIPTPNYLLSASFLPIANPNIFGSHF